MEFRTGVCFETRVPWITFTTFMQLRESSVQLSWWTGSVLHCFYFLPKRAPLSRFKSFNAFSNVAAYVIEMMRLCNEVENCNRVNRQINIEATFYFTRSVAWWATSRMNSVTRRQSEKKSNRWMSYFVSSRLLRANFKSLCKRNSASLPFTNDAVYDTVLECEYQADANDSILCTEEKLS